MEKIINDVICLYQFTNKVVCANDMKYIKHVERKLNEEYGKWNLQMTIEKKTQYLRIEEETDDLTFDNETINNVNNINTEV